MAAKPSEITVALDWRVLRPWPPRPQPAAACRRTTSPRAAGRDRTPNTNHIGMYVAKAQGLYEKAGLTVTLLSPHHDEYKTTPASRCDAHTAAARALQPPLRPPAAARRHRSQTLTLKSPHTND